MIAADGIITIGLSGSLVLSWEYLLSHGCCLPPCSPTPAPRITPEIEWSGFSTARSLITHHAHDARDICHMPMTNVQLLADSPCRQSYRPPCNSARLLGRPEQCYTRFLRTCATWDFRGSRSRSAGGIFFTIPFPIHRGNIFYYFLHTQRTAGGIFLTRLTSQTFHQPLDNF